MNFEQFENLARLYVVGALDDDEILDFQSARENFGVKAEEAIREFRRLNEAFALSLRPCPPATTTKQKLLQMIRDQLDGQAATNNK